MKTQRNFVIIKKLNNKQFIHTNLLLASPNCKKQLCESKASGREKRKICKAKRHEEEQMLFRVFCCGKEVTSETIVMISEGREDGSFESVIRTVKWDRDVRLT